MNRSMLVALIGAFAALSGPVWGQTVSTKQEAWAVEALGKMKRVGLLKAYPDGLFQPRRTLSRQEIAVAAHAAYLRLENVSKGLGGQRTKLDQILDENTRNGGLVFSAEELKQLRELLGDAGAMAAEMSALAESAANLTRLAADFEDELNALGVDVDAMRLTLAGLADRIGRLEQDTLPFELDVEYNLVSHLGHSSDRKFGVTVDGRPTGVSGGSSLFPLGGGGGPRPVGLTRDVNFGHEMALNMKGESGAIDWKASIAFGNLATGTNLSAEAYFVNGGFYGNQSSTLFAQPFHDGEPNLYVQNLELSWSGNIARRDANFRVGRIGAQGNPWLFRRMDTTPYFSNARWDDHNWYFDGAEVTFPMRSEAKLAVYGGRQSDRRGSFGNGFGGLWPMTVGEIQAADGLGRLDVSQHIGLNYFDHPCRHMSFDLTLMQLNSDNESNFTGPRGDYNRMDLIGFNANYTFPCRKTLNFGFAESIYKNDSSTVMGNDNRAYWASLPWNKGRATGTVGWRQIEANYGAPGDWGRMGPNWRAVDHKGWNASVDYRADQDNDLSLDTYLYNGLAGEFNQFNAGEEMRGLTFDWYKRLSPTARLRTGYEVFESNDDGDRARFEWFRLGFEHDLGYDTFLNCLYEISSASAEDGTRYRSYYGDRRRGGLVTVQFGRKY